MRKLHSTRLLVDLIVGLDTREDINRVQFDTTPLIAACRSAHVEFALWLLRHGADPNKPRHRHGVPPIFYACGKRCLPIILALLAAGAVANHGIISILQGDPLREEADRRIVYALIDRGARWIPEKPSYPWAHAYFDARHQRRSALRALGAIVSGRVRTKDTRRLIMKNAK